MFRKPKNIEKSALIDWNDVFRRFAYRLFKVMDISR